MRNPLIFYIRLIQESFNGGVFSLNDLTVAIMASDKIKLSSAYFKANRLINKRLPVEIIANGIFRLTVTVPVEEKSKKASSVLKNQDLSMAASGVLSYLNSTVGMRLKATPANISKITARLNEGFTLEDFMIVIDKKNKEWKGTGMAKFLKPDTLFGNKFDSYLNQLEGSDNKVEQMSSYSFEKYLPKKGV